jgi:hypothetical protein
MLAPLPVERPHPLRDDEHGQNFAHFLNNATL